MRQLGLHPALDITTVMQQRRWKAMDLVVVGRVHTFSILRTFMLWNSTVQLEIIKCSDPSFPLKSVDTVLAIPRRTFVCQLCCHITLSSPVQTRQSTQAWEVLVKVQESYNKTPVSYRCLQFQLFSSRGK